MSYHQPYGQPAPPPQQPQHLPGPPSPDSPTASTSRKRARPADMDQTAQQQGPPGLGNEYKDYYGNAAPTSGAAAGYYDTSGGGAVVGDTTGVGAAGDPSAAAGFAMEHGDGEGEDDEDDEPTGRRGGGDASKAGRRKIKIEFIQDKSRRHITFSKRKAGIMKKAYELSTLTGTQVLLLVVSETGLVYTFTTAKLQPLVTQPEGKNLIQACLNAPTNQPGGSGGSSSSGQPGPGPPGSGAGASGGKSGGGSSGGGSGGGGGGGRNMPGGLGIGGGGGGGPVDAAEPPADLVGPGPLDPASSPTAPYHPQPAGGYGGYTHPAPPPRSISSSTAASNSSPALTHAPSPSMGAAEGKRARRRTEIAQDVSMGVPAGGAAGLPRRNTMPDDPAVGVVPGGEYDHVGTPPQRSYSVSSGAGAPGGYQAPAPGGWGTPTGHHPQHHHQAPQHHHQPTPPVYGAPPVAAQQGWGDYGGGNARR